MPGADGPAQQRLAGIAAASAHRSLVTAAAVKADYVSSHACAEEQC